MCGCTNYRHDFPYMFSIFTCNASDTKLVSRRQMSVCVKFYEGPGS